MNVDDVASFDVESVDHCLQQSMPNPEPLKRILHVKLEYLSVLLDPLVKPWMLSKVPVMNEAYDAFPNFGDQESTWPKVSSEKSRMRVNVPGTLRIFPVTIRDVFEVGALCGSDQDWSILSHLATGRGQNMFIISAFEVDQMNW